MLHWIYPRLCELCHRPCEMELCADCMSRLPRVPMPICLRCGALVAGELADPYSCSQCAGRPSYFDFARSALITAEQTMPLIYRFKYHRANYLAPAFAGLLNELWQDTPLLRAYDDWCLVPVPIGRKHLFKRGYNQAEELARALGAMRGLPVVNALERRTTQADSQTRLSAAERRKNAMEAYAARSSWAESRRRLPRHLVLVDDVYTTGSTARACARALKSLPGVEQVGVVTLLRAVRRGSQDMLPLG